MENIIVYNFMRLIAPLKIETKLELLTKLSENLREDYRTGSIDKENLLEELHGSWSDTKDSLSEDKTYNEFL